VAAQGVVVALLAMAVNVRKIVRFMHVERIGAGTVRRLPRRRRAEPIGSWRGDLPEVASEHAPPIVSDA